MDECKTLQVDGSIHQHVEGKQKFQWHKINFEPRYQRVIKTKSSGYINTIRPMMLRRRKTSDQPYAVVVRPNLKYWVVQTSSFYWTKHIWGRRCTEQQKFQNQQLGRTKNVYFIWRVKKGEKKANDSLKYIQTNDFMSCQWWPWNAGSLLKRFGLTGGNIALCPISRIGCLKPLPFFRFSSGALNSLQAAMALSLEDL